MFALFGVSMKLTIHQALQSEPCPSAADVSCHIQADLVSLVSVSLIQLVILNRK